MQRAQLWWWVGTFAACGFAGAQNQTPRAPRAQVVVKLPPERPEELRWRAFAELRERLGLPQKHGVDLTEPRADGWRAAMREIAAGHALVREDDEAEPDGPPDAARQARLAARDQAALDRFEQAGASDEAGPQALLALAVASTDARVARLAVRAPRAEVLGLPGDVRVPALLVPLLEHEDDGTAGAAWRQLVWVLDAGCAPPGLLDELVDEVLDAPPAPIADVRIGAWDPQRRVVPGPATLHAFEPPANALTRRLTLAAASGRRDLLERVHAQKYDARVQLLMHTLAAPRCDARMAKKLFGWYSRGARGWTPRQETGLNNWEYGVVSVLVSVAPHVPKEQVGFYRQHLQGHAAPAVAEFAKHRLLRIGAGSAAQPAAWLEASTLPLGEATSLDLLELWRSLGAADAPGLVDGLLAARSQRGRLRRALLRRALLLAPRADDAAERDAFARWFAAPDPAVARAAAERFTAYAGDDPGRVELLRDALRAARDAGGACAQNALEAAIAAELSLGPHQWPDGARDLVALQRLHDAGAQVDAARLEDLLVARPGAGAARLRRAALHAARRLPAWSAVLARRVAACTTAVDADTRRAAYRALASRGAEAHAEAGLVDERAFDRAVVVRFGAAMP